MTTMTGFGVYDFLKKKFSVSDPRSFEQYLKAYYLDKYHLDRLAHVCEIILPQLSPGMKLLDLGSDGLFPYTASALVEDIEPFALSKWNDEIHFSADGRGHSRRCGDRWDPQATPNSIKISECDLEQDRFPFADDSIDVITCFEVIEHLKSDPMSMMMEVNRVLKKDGGLFFLSTPNINSLKALKRLLQHESPYFCPPYRVNDAEIGHVKEYSVKELNLLFRQSGFAVEKIETFDHRNDEQFSHDRLYRIGSSEAAADVDEGLLESALQRFLAEIRWDRSLRGDYLFFKASWQQRPKERFFFPLYESY